MLDFSATRGPPTIPPASPRLRQRSHRPMARAARTLAILLLAAPAARAQSPPTADPAPPAKPAAPRSPLPPPGEMARCKALIDAGHYEAARERLRPIVEQHPGWARATGLLALTYYKQHRFAAARPLFARALSADPEEVAIRPFYGWTLYSLGEPGAAEEEFRVLLGRMPEYTVAHYALGLIHLDRDEVDAARERFAATLRLAAEQGDVVMAGRAHARLGDLAVRLGDLAAAKRELELAIALHPDEHDALFTLSRVLQRLGDEEGAAEARRRFDEVAARLEPGAARLPE